MKNLLLSLTLILSANAWAEPQENIEGGFLDADAIQERLELHAKTSRGIACNFNTKRYIVVDDLDKTSDEGEASNYWYISDSHILIREDGYLAIMASMQNGKWIQPSYWNGEGFKVVVNENEISITQVLTEKGLRNLRKVKTYENLERQVNNFSLERNTGRYFSSEKMYLKEEKVDNVTDEYLSRGSCSAIEPDKRKF